MLWTPPLGRRSWSADSQNRNLPLDTMLVGWRTNGAGVLGPQWERYGKAPNVAVEPGNVFAVEMELEAPGYGLVGLEEQAIVTSAGAKYLSNAQRELWVLPRKGR